jgi:hypothetical protein
MLQSFYIKQKHSFKRLKNWLNELGAEAREPLVVVLIDRLLVILTS